MDDERATVRLADGRAKLRGSVDVRAPVNDAGCMFRRLGGEVLFGKSLGS